MPITNKTCCVTGAAGFVGSHVVDELVLAGHKVIGVDDLSGGYMENVNESCTFYKQDVKDYQMMKRIFETHKPNYVFAIHAYPAEGMSHFVRRYNYETNLMSMLNLINLSVNYNVERIVFTSSIAVMGGEHAPPFTEEMTPHPEDPYGISKYAIELDLQAANDMFGLKYTIFRPQNVIGIRQNIHDVYRNVVSIFILQAMKGEDLTIFGDGEQTRAFSWIDYVKIPVARCVEFYETENEIFNVGATQPFSINELAETVRKVVNPKVNIVHLPPRIEVKHAYGDSSKIRNVIPVNVSLTLEEMVGIMYQWVKDKPLKDMPKWENVEIMKGMPEKWKTHVKSTL